jgi:putative tryptophan/tyrosine transport system substrate-binding protein
MRRREFVVGLAATIFLQRVADAQQRSKVWRIGVLDTAPRQFNSENMTAFVRGLRELGYEEGRNLSLDYRTVGGNADQLAIVASELIRSNVDLIAVRGTPEVLALHQETKTIPIVMLAVVDPVDIGVASSLNRPGGNVTGLSSTVTVLESKRLGSLRELLPAFKSLAFIGDLRNRAVQNQWNEVQTAAKPLHLEPIQFSVQKAADIKAAFDLIQRNKFDALRVGVDGVTRTNQRLIIDLAQQSQLPAIYSAREFADEGGLIAYGANYPALYYRAASFVDKILKGSSPSEIPIEQPTKFELVINLKAARALKLEIPEKILALADEVIE